MYTDVMLLPHWKLLIPYHLQKLSGQILHVIDGSVPLWMMVSAIFYLAKDLFFKQISQAKGLVFGQIV